MTNAAMATTIELSAKDNYSPAFQKMFKSLDAISGQLSSLSSKADSAGGKTTSAFGRMVSGVEDLERSGRRTSRVLTGIAEVYGVGLAYRVGKAAFDMSGAWSSSTMQIGQSAKLLSTPVQHLDALSGAATLAGSSSEALTGGLMNLQQGMYDAAGGRNGEMAALLNLVGVHGGTATEALDKFADAIQHTRSPMAKLDLATRAFGSAGVALLPFLDRGSAGIARLSRQAERYGLVSDMSVKNAYELAEAQGAVSLSWRHLQNSFFTDLGPTLATIFMQVADAMQPIRKDLDAWANTDGPKNLAKGVGDLIGDVKELKTDIDSAFDAYRRLKSVDVPEGTESTRSYYERRLPVMSSLENKGSPYLPSFLARSYSDQIRASANKVQADADDVHGLLRPTPALAGIVAEVSKAQNIDPSILRAMIHYETHGKFGGNPGSTAYGFMQTLQGTAEGEGEDHTKPIGDVTAGAKYFNKLLQQAGGDFPGAMMAYHDGPGLSGDNRGLDYLRNHPGANDRYTHFSADAQNEAFKVTAWTRAEQQAAGTAQLGSDANGVVRVEVHVTNDASIGTRATVQTTGRGVQVSHPRVARTSVGY